MNRKTRRNINAILKQCKKHPYLWGIAPLSMLGWLMIDSINKDSILGKLFNGEKNAKRIK